VLLAALLLIVVLRVRAPWPVKVAAVLATSAFYCVTFFRLMDYPMVGSRTIAPQFNCSGRGWSTRTRSIGTPARVHVWVEELDAAIFRTVSRAPTGLPYFPGACRQSGGRRAMRYEGPSQGGRAADNGTGTGQPAPEGPSEVSKLRPRQHRAAIRRAAGRSTVS